jgi:hypothetical protein
MNYVSTMWTTQTFLVKDLAKFKEELATLVQLEGCPFEAEFAQYGNGLHIVPDNDAEGSVWVGGEDASLQPNWDELDDLLKKAPPEDWDPVTEQPGYEAVVGVPAWLKECVFTCKDAPVEQFDVIAFLQRHIVEEGDGSVGVIMEVGNEGLRGGHAFVCLFTYDNCIYKNHNDMLMLAEKELDEEKEDEETTCREDKHENSNAGQEPEAPP